MWDPTLVGLLLTCSISKFQELRQRVYERTDEWIVFYPFDEAGSDRILQDISDDRVRTLVFAEDSLERITLPQSFLELAGMLVGRILLRAGNEPLAVGFVGLAFYEEVKVVGHEVVRNNCKPVFR